MPSKLLNPNLANDPHVKKLAEAELIPLLRKIRNDRNTMREMWMRYYRIWACTRDQQAYRGRSQTWIPKGRKKIENWVRRLKKDLFPQDQWFEVKARRAIYESRSQTLEALLMYLFTKHTMVRRHATPFLRQLVTLGTSPVKVIWRHEESEIRFLRDMFDDEGKPTGRWETIVERAVKFVGPTFRVVDLFAWYAFPYTVPDVNDCTVLFEDLLVDKDRVRALGRKLINPEDEDYGHIYENVEEFLDKRKIAEAKDKFQAEQRRLADKGFTQILDMKVADTLIPCDVTEAIWKRDLDDDGHPEQYLCAVGADEVLLRVQKNPWFHGSSHWLCGKFVEVADEFYGHGLPELFDRLQYQLVDSADQATDALTWAMNPVTVVDTFMVGDPQSYRMRPGAKWLAQGDVNKAVRMLEPPKESAVVGLNAVAQYGAMIDEAADVAPLTASQTKSRGKTSQTSAGAQLLVAESQVDVQEVVLNIEEQVFEPFLRLCHALIQQYMTQRLVLQIEGSDGGKFIEKQVSVEDVIGDFEFDWLGSQKAMNEQVRAQQMANGLAIVSKIPQEQLGNKRIDFGELISDFFRIGLGLRKSYIKDVNPQTSLDWRIENQLFLVDRGAEVTVSQADNDLEHSLGHQELIKDPDVDDDVKRQVLNHIQAHVASHMAKEQMRLKQEAQQQGMMYAAKGAQNGGPRPPMMGGGRLPQTGGLDDLMRKAPRGV